ncbi:energy transducer TonB [Robiginitalea aurantiaca]|uniref:Energy transducer TonB n=1 Tax=Robiginitalea aurantiaca TaxID=3056915 RepID=A0ABT7WGT2_9FLAO|nr:hypothetical protein [Robiginitalea aurantiaca]MDM9632127.1 hypothetical protein [Robiginitalea aurantiaca]
MNKSLKILFVAFFVALSTNGQNLFFIGENSFPSTETIILSSNSSGEEDLNISFAKAENNGLITLDRKVDLGEFGGKLIIYLSNGNVISCDEVELSEIVDGRARAVYFFTNEQLNQLKGSNLLRVRYTLKYLVEKNYSASNKDAQTDKIITAFFDKSYRSKQMEMKESYGSVEESNSSLVDPYVSTYYGSPGSGSGSGSYGLSGRSLASKEAVRQECNEEGRVVVQIEVDRSGKVIKVTPGVRGTTNNSSCLLESARKTALGYSWNSDDNAPDRQIGFVVVNF